MWAGLLQSVPMDAAECVQGAVLTSSLAHQKIFYWKKNILCEFGKLTILRTQLRHYETINDDYACPDFI